MHGRIGRGCTLALAALHRHEAGDVASIHRMGSAQ